MAKTNLVDRYVASGRLLLQLLDGAGISVVGAMWLYSSEVDRWSLLLALPGVRERGRREAYERIQDVFRPNAARLKPLRFTDLTVKDVAEEPFRQVRGVVSTSRDAVDEIDFGENVIEGTVIDDALIYRMS